MEWEKLLKVLKDCVPAGSVTTYGNLLKYKLGNTGKPNTISSMLNAAVRANDENKIWTNRVVNLQGKITKKNSAREQLKEEGIPILANGCVDLQQCPPVNISNCIDDGISCDNVHLCRQQGEDVNRYYRKYNWRRDRDSNPGWA